MENDLNLFFAGEPVFIPPGGIKPRISNEIGTPRVADVAGSGLNSARKLP
jgi:hypothetical protein